MGHLFEQFIMLELVRKCRRIKERFKVCYWRDPGGPEVDCVLDRKDLLIPIEIKYSDRPDKNDARHIMTFLDEYKEATKGYIVCQAPRKMKIHDNVYAIPWQELSEVLA